MTTRARPRRRASDEVSARFLTGLFLVIALVAAIAGGIIGEMRYATGCALAPDAPGKTYTRAVLRCELPWWWKQPST